MRNQAKLVNIKHNFSPYLLTNDHFRPENCADCANCDPDFDNVSDDTREIIAGLRDLARMEGEAAQ